MLIAKHVQTHTRNDVIGESDHVDGGGGGGGEDGLTTGIVSVSV